jgi:hypothetical protein
MKPPAADRAEVDIVHLRDDLAAIAQLDPQHVSDELGAEQTVAAGMHDSVGHQFARQQHGIADEIDRRSVADQVDEGPARRS